MEKTDFWRKELWIIYRMLSDIYVKVDAADVIKIS